MYKLLTPGPLTTTVTVKKQMLIDHCTWDDDYKAITQTIRKKLLKIAHASEDTYTTVLMQGSGTFGVESVLTSSIGPTDKLLIAANGSYGLRMADIAKTAMIHHMVYKESYDRVPDPATIARLLAENPEITHVSIVHCETTSGILNDIRGVADVVKKAGKILIVDAMSSFGGIDIPVESLGIDFLISSSNKCIQGVPGFSFIIARRNCLEQCAGQARSLSLDLYGQWKEMEKDGKWRFTSPTHVVLAFSKALEELEQQGGVSARYKRYAQNNLRLIEGMQKLGFRTYIAHNVQSPIITTFLYPDDYHFSFQEMYRYIKDRGYVIYPGKLTDADTFRIGNIGEIYLEDIEKLLTIIQEYTEQKKNI
ncbi:MAG: 2-aminoethylphosphonate--pyruvate transaminase [Candidatus Merdivicinus sp.]|jgi:2-aminoethylphosphonate-pyruvate transaminase